MQSNLSKQELIDIIQWDVKSWSRAIPFWLKHVELKKGQKALAIGERGGGLSLWLAKNGLNVQCTDYNDFPDTTKELHAKYGLSDKITYTQGVDVTDLSQFQDESFDVVVFKSVIGALSKKEKQQQALDEIFRVLKPGGSLIFAENLIGTKLHIWLRKKFVRWDSYWRYLHWKNDKDLFRKFSKQIFTSTGFTANFGRSEKQRSILGIADKTVVWAMPKTWRYILMGVLKK